MAKDFVRSQPPPYAGLPAPEGFNDFFEFDVIGKVYRRPPAAELGSVIGDVVNNLRAALDNLVWELTVQEQRRHGFRPPRNPIPRNDRWRNVAFPIVVEATAWQPREAKCLWGVRPALRADFKALQPFEVRKKGPRRHELAMLEELWNIDKHRHLHLGQWAVGLAAVRSSLQQVWAGKITFDRDFEFEIVDKFGGRFVNGTKLGRVRVIGDPPIGPNPWMYMQAYLSVEIAFGKGSPAYGGRVIETLRALHETTSLVIRQFKAEFP